MLRCSNQCIILQRNNFSRRGFKQEPSVIVDLFSKTLANPQVLLEPWVKTNQAIAANIEQVVAFQINALKTNLDIQLNQLRAAAEISDMQGARALYQRQAVIARAIQQKLLSDTTALSDLAARFKAEMDDLTQSALDEILLDTA